VSVGTIGNLIFLLTFCMLEKNKNGGNVKRIMGLALWCFVSGCETAPDNGQQSMLVVQSPKVQEKIFRQDTAPLPWVHVLPSERAAHFLDADFDYLARRIRHAMTINPAKFSDVRLVLVDYAILEPKLLTTKPMKKKYKGQKYCKEYISKPERYFMRLSFYRQNQQPPAPPLFVGAAVLSVRHAAPFEAMHFLVDDIIDEHLKLPYNQVEVNLDAAEDIEKNLQELAATTTPKTPKVSSKSETSELPHKAHSSTKKTSTSSSSTAASATMDTSSSSATPSLSQGTSTAVPTPSPGTSSSSATPSLSQGTSTAVPTPSPGTSSSSATPSLSQGTSTAAPTPSPGTSSSSATPSLSQGTSTAAPTPSPGTSSSSATPSLSQGTSTAAPSSSPAETSPAWAAPSPSQGTSTVAATSSSATTPSP
jgi:hypothetical protein